MKKHLFVFFLFLMFPAFGEYSQNIVNACGNYGVLTAVFTPNQYSCSTGEYLPANSAICESCPNGYACSGGTFYFNDITSQGLSKDANLRIQNEANTCAVNFPHVLTAVFTPNQYSCGAGEYLPANSATCESCPNGYACSGGTFYFNDITSQGLSKDANLRIQNEANTCAVNFPHVLTAVFTPNSHTCSAGYYLPAGVDECTICPVNSACVGGTYTYNETTDQGIQSCASGTFAPTGSAVCYQHILHVGDDIVYLRSTKLTTPSLNIQIGNDIFYANMTTTPTYMNKDSSHYLHILYEGIDYYVCDDTTYVAPAE